MFVDERSAQLTLVRENRTFYFCAESCLAQFADPEQHRRRLVRRLAVAWPLSIAVAALTYGVTFGGSRDVALALALVVQVYPGASFYAGTRDALRSRVWNMDVLVAVATTAAFGYSAAVLLMPGQLPPALYFDASSLIITLILSGSFLELSTRRRAAGARRRLAELLPREVRVLGPGGEALRPLDQVAVGAVLRVPPGERVPVDGLVRAGHSSVDESWIAGESRPLAKGPSDRVVAGSVNLEGVLDIEAVATGDATYLAEVGRLLAEAELGQAPLRRLADRIADRFVPVVLAIAIAAAVGWYLAGAGAPTALLVFVTVAITACPCAFGIATPAALAQAVGQASRHGILFRGRDALERAAAIDVIVTDKTGTLTYGHPALTEVVPVEGRTSQELLALAAGLDAELSHPFALAVRNAARDGGVLPARVEEVKVEPGIGASGRWRGHRVTIRAPAVGEAERWTPPLALAAQRWERDGRGWSVVAEDETIVGLLAFDDPVRPHVRSTIRELRDQGIEVVLATGDGAGAARTVATAAGIAQVRSRLTPAEKLAWVRELQAAGWRVAFVGDGINDAPALLGADLGVAVGGGTDVAQEAGQVVLVRAGFEAIPAVLETGRRALAKVRQNLGWAIGYNAVLIPIAAGALVPWYGLGVYSVLPIAGALAMGLSSTTVVLNSLSLRVAPARAPTSSAPQPSGAAA